MLDLAYTEDVRAETDMNIVVTGRGLFVEVQGTAEGAPFDRRELDALLDLGVAGGATLRDLQTAALATPTTRHPSPPDEPSRWCWPRTTSTRWRSSSASSAPRMPSITVVAYDGPEPVEDGVTFAENALIKARAAAAHTGLVALADDSGICVDVLGGAPGIFSARWAGGRDSAENLALLLAQLSDIADPHRGAHFTCAIAVVAPDAAGRPRRSRRSRPGEWPGRLGHRGIRCPRLRLRPDLPARRPRRDAPRSWRPR